MLDSLNKLKTLIFVVSQNGILRLKYISFVFAILTAMGSNAQVIFENSITGSNPNTSNPYTTGQTNNANLTVSGIGRGSGITGSNGNNR